MDLPAGYDTKLQKEWSNGVDLSLGQWQKLAISRAFLKQSPIVLLDEPTASLDAEAEYEMYKRFRDLKEKSLCLLVTQRLGSLSLAEKIIVLEDGEIAEIGSHDTLMNENGIYRKLQTMQKAFNL